MKELKAPENVKIKEFDIEVRPYLLSQDIMDIGESMLKFDNRVEQDLCLMVGVFERCTDIPKEALDENPLDLFINSGLWAKVRDVVIGINDIRVYVNHKEDFYKTMAREIPAFLDRAIDVLSEFNSKLSNSEDLGRKLKELPDEINAVVDALSKSGNAELINNAMKLVK